MRKILIWMVALSALAMASCSGNGGRSADGNTDGGADSATVSAEKRPKIAFDTALYNFGRILQGEQVSTVFRFRNEGDAELLIQRVETSCGCTVPEYDRQPVAPGASGSIRVRFDSDGKEGQQYKTIKVISNCEENIFDLVITGEVEVR